MKPIPFKVISIFIAANIFGLITFLISCKNFTTSTIDKGIIEYKISYPNPAEVTMSLDLMPKTLVFKFDTNNTVSEISAGMGVFNTYVLTDKEKKFVTQRLSVMGKKFKIDFNEKQLDSLIASEPSIVYKTTEETKVIAGYKCRKVICEFQDSLHTIADIYYTNDIKVSNPNWYSIYNKIDGVLMEYYIKRYGISMKFTAKSVSAEGIDENTFKPEAGYTNISNIEMASYFKMY